MIEPANCTVLGGSITTSPVTGIVGMNTGGTGMTIKYTPQSGLTLATIQLDGALCAAEGLYKFAGAEFVKAVNATGVFAKPQILETSAAIQGAAGEAPSSKFGEKPAFVEGSLEATLEGEVGWAAKET